MTSGLQINGIYIVHGSDKLTLKPHHLTLPREWHWKCRKGSSAGSAQNHTQGFITRAHLAMRLSFPLDQARRAIARLVAIALAVGMARVLDREFKSMLLHALVHLDVWVIYQLGA